ncbi:MAG: hypothetical protein MZV64_34690 [Ignavibacteriales bacterium]|nr:hypothetical protein [Ignavibacteriales bacterium]
MPTRQNCGPRRSSGGRGGGILPVRGRFGWGQAGRRPRLGPQPLRLNPSQPFAPVETAGGQPGPPGGFDQPQGVVAAAGAGAKLAGTGDRAVIAGSGGGVHVG